MRTLVLGLGNPILTDDGVGLQVARRVRENLGGRDGVSVQELYAGGIRLIDVLSGFDRVLLVDAMLSKQRAPGEWVSFRLSADDSPLQKHPLTHNASSTHDLDLPTTLEMGRKLGMPMPSEVWVWGVEASDVETFSEQLTSAVAGAVGPVAEEVSAFAASRGAQ